MPEDANRYIRPDPKPHIDHERERLERETWRNALELIKRRDLPRLLELLRSSGFTSEECERAKQLYREFRSSGKTGGEKP